MQSYYQYLIISSTSIGVLYLAYYYFFRKINDFKKIRIFLLSALVFSLLLPLNPVSINLSDYLAFNNQESNKSLRENIIYKGTENNLKEFNSSEFELTKSTNSAPQDHFDAEQMFLIIYLAVTGLFVLRLIISITKMILLSIYAEKIKHKNYTLILLDKRIIAFSFFNWIFIDKTIDKKELKQIIEHEKAHAEQYHTFDLLFSELLVATMWFNPFVWMFKKALTQVHEYLADEQVLNSGFNKLEYQQLLVNQAAEERLIAVSSNFSYSLIKKRIMMMQKTKTHGQVGMKFLAVVPIVAVLIFSVACFNQPIEASVMNGADLILPSDTIRDSKLLEHLPTLSISPNRANILYIGIDNPVSIYTNSNKKAKLKVTIDNGTITKKNDIYIVRVKELGQAIINVRVNDTITMGEIFRVKRVPDPIPAIIGHWDQNTLAKKEIIKAKGLEVKLENFDFDIWFKVVGFTISVINENGVMESASQENGNQFSEQQIKLISKTKSGSKIYIEDIRAIGAAEIERVLNPLIIKIK